jgi:hypothetical protein
MRQPAVESNLICQTCALRLIDQPPAHITFPNQVKFPGAEVVGQSRASIKENVQPFYWLEITYEQNVTDSRSEPKFRLSCYPVARAENATINPVDDYPCALRIRSKLDNPLSEIL